MGMTNGEMIQKVFNCEVCEPIPEDDIIHVIFPDKNDSAIGFDWSWWNMEYKGSTTKNNLGVDCISRIQAIDAFPDLLPNIGYNKKAITEILQEVPPVTPQEPTIKALGEELRKARTGIADEKVLIGYNMAIAICNKHLGESEG